MTEQRQRPHRERGFYLPADEVQIHLANGWTILDIPAGTHEVLMKPPVSETGIAA